jgi:Zn-dependent peptidase ImmA (M78 family)
MNRFIGNSLRKARESVGLSQGAFARAVGLSSEYISLLEAEKRTPSFATLQKIASYVQRDIGFFFQEKPAPSDPFTLLFRAETVDDRAREELLKFRRYCDAYLQVEALTGRRLDLAPLYPPNISAERMADEERRRLGLGDEPIRDIFALFEANGCRFLRLPMPDDSKVSGVFIFLELKEAAFALVNAAQSLGRQVFSAAHEYCHYLKDRYGGPVIENPDMFIDEYVALYHPREQFAQTFAARFLMPPPKVRELTEKNFRSQRLSFDQTLYVKRYFGVSAAAMLRTLRGLGLISKSQFEDFSKVDPGPREKELFGHAADEDEHASSGVFRKAMGGRAGGPIAGAKRRMIPSDRFKLLRREAGQKITREKAPAGAAQKNLPADEE